MEALLSGAFPHLTEKICLFLSFNDLEKFSKISPFLRDQIDSLIFWERYFLRRFFVKSRLGHGLPETGLFVKMGEVN